MRLGIKRSHPDKAPCAPGNLGQMLNRIRIHPARREVKSNPAKHLDPRYCFACKIGDTGGRLVVILDNDASHAALFGQTSEIDCIDGPGKTVRTAMTMNINHARQGSCRNRWGHGITGDGCGFTENDVGIQMIFISRSASPTAARFANFISEYLREITRPLPPPAKHALVHALTTGGLERLNCRSTFAMSTSRPGHISAFVPS